MNFYSYKFEEVCEMRNDLFEYLYACMMKAKATERINAMDNHIYAHVKPDVAKKIHKKLYEQAMPDSAKKERVVTMEDLKKHGFETLASKG